MLRRDAYGDATSLNVRQWEGETPDRKDKKIMTLQPISGHWGVFGANKDAGYSWDLAIPGNSIRPVIVEGEFNWLSILAQAQKWSGPNDHCYFEPGFAVGGKNGADISTITKLLDGDVPVVIYDNDTVDWDSFDRPMPRGYPRSRACEIPSLRSCASNTRRLPAPRSQFTIVTSDRPRSATERLCFGLPLATTRPSSTRFPELRIPL